MAPDVLTKGLFSRVLEAPSHVILNHVNCWTERDPTLAPNASTTTNLDNIDSLSGKMHQIQQQEMIDEERTSLMQEKEYRADKGMTAVSLTLRLNMNKFATLTYYKPKIPAQPPTTDIMPLGQKIYVEDM